MVLVGIAVKSQESCSREAIATAPTSLRHDHFSGSSPAVIAAMNLPLYLP